MSHKFKSKIEENFFNLLRQPNDTITSFSEKSFKDFVSKQKALDDLEVWISKEEFDELFIQNEINKEKSNEIQKFLWNFAVLIALFPTLICIALLLKFGNMDNFIVDVFAVFWTFILSTMSITYYSYNNKYCKSVERNREVLTYTRELINKREEIYFNDFKNIVSNYWKFSELGKTVPKYWKDLLENETIIKKTVLNLIEDNKNEQYWLDHTSKVFSILFDKVINSENTKSILLLFSKEELISIIDILIKFDNPLFVTIYNKIIPSILKTM